MLILNENPVCDRMPGLAKEFAADIDKALVRNPKSQFRNAIEMLKGMAH